MARTDHKLELRRRRHARVRRRVQGSGTRPRLAVFRSNKHISAQLIDDDAGTTLASASTVEVVLRDAGGGNIEAARAVGLEEGAHLRQQSPIFSVALAAE